MHSIDLSLANKMKFKLPSFLQSFKPKHSAPDKANATSPDHALLPPSPIWSRILIWTLGSGSVFLLIWSFVVKIDETVVFSGELTTSVQAVSLSVPDRGVINQVNVRPHKFVNKGDVLFVFSDDETDLRLVSIRRKLKLLKLRKVSDINLNKLRQEQIIEQIRYKADLLARHEYLLKSGAIEETQVLQLRSDLAKARLELGSLKEESQRSQYQIDQSIEEFTNSIKELEAKRERFTVRSPVTGYIQKLKYESVGEQIQAGEEIASIIPKLGLIGRVSIPSKLKAPVEVNAPATVSVDAFPADDYGTINAFVRSISPMTEANRGEQQQNAQGKLYNADLTLVAPDMPEKLSIDDLRPGMFISAQMVLRNKPVITSVFNILDDVFKPLSEQR